MSLFISFDITLDEAHFKYFAPLIALPDGANAHDWVCAHMGL